MPLETPGKSETKDMNLHERIATALGWTVKETQGFSLQALRDLVRPVNDKLAHQITDAIQTGSYFVETEPPPVVSEA